MGEIIGIAIAAVWRGGGAQCEAWLELMDRDGQNTTLFDSDLNGETWRNMTDSQEIFWSDDENFDNDNFFEQYVSTNSEIITVEPDSADCKIKLVEVIKDKENWADYEIEVESNISVI